ncbi:hypothetical protein HGRIS_012050 [Hohenbuehelia grisea]|uniref:Serpentine receptor class gamma n=1 Tax=Hohenbuehelia grisea TaxID=104357 RepID=A0ABR3IR64_9AGAR
MGISIAKAQLLSIFTETLLYGVYFSLYWVTIIILLQRRRSGHTQYRRLIPVATILLLSATAHLVLDFVRIIQGFIESDDANAYYNNIPHPLHVAKTALYITHVTTGDCVLIWRCYIVYNKSLFVLIPPLIMSMADAVSGYYGTYILTKAGSAATIFNTGRVLILSFCSLTMSTNIFCTGAIVWRIYWTRRATVSTQHSLFYVVMAVVESGAIYTLGVLSSLIAYVAGSNGQYVALDIVTPLSGITFSLIIIQIHFHLYSKSQSTTAGPMTGIIFKQKSKCITSEEQNSSRTYPYSLKPSAFSSPSS